MDEFILFRNGGEHCCESREDLISEVISQLEEFIEENEIGIFINGVPHRVQVKVTLRKGWIPEVERLHPR
jgi:hypothetical protein